MYLKEEDLQEIIKVFKELCLNKYRIVFKDNTDDTHRFELTIEGHAQGGVHDLLKRTLLTAINTVLDGKGTPVRVVPLLAPPSPEEKKEVVPKKESKLSVKGNHIMWDILPKTRQ